MGSQVSATVANLYMEFFEDMVLPSKPHSGRGMLMASLASSKSERTPQKGFEIPHLFRITIKRLKIIY